MEGSSRPKLGARILETLVLGIVLAVTGYFLIGQYQSRSAAAEYRQTVFARRMDAYIDLLAAAREARDEYVLVFARSDSNGVASGVWESRFMRVRERIEKLRGSRSEADDAAWDAFTYADALAALKKVDAIRRTHGAYFHADIETAVDAFLSAMLDALDASIPSPEVAADPTAAASAVRRSQEAYATLREKILARMPDRGVLQD